MPKVYHSKRRGCVEGHSQGQWFCVGGEIAEEKTGKGCGEGFEGIVNSGEEFDFLIR